MIKYGWILLVSLFTSLGAQAATWQYDWSGYIDGTVGKPPYYLYSQVLNSYDSHKQYRALDLGSGAGDLDVDLVAKGWDVTGVDSSTRSGEVIQERTKSLAGTFQFQQADFSSAILSGNYDLVISFFSLPYGKKRELSTLLKMISLHMKSGALLAMNFFGYEQTWVKNGLAYGLSKEEIFNFLTQNNFKIKYFLNRVYDQRDFNNDNVHWDVLDVVAEKQ